ncbi:sensor domain-containing diguanylate cyclase [Xanthobacter sp. KR7-225]|uniref:GGDEF domain-containing protein n=1 Tax=Xanthobacter sp. KR7-225 TaxID=3156613 RepID=UPI0032B5A9F4
MTADSLAWVDLVQVPLLVVDAGDGRIVRGNLRARSLLGSLDLQGDLADFLGAYAAGRLKPLISGEVENASELVLYCRTRSGLATLGFKPARIPEQNLCVLTLRPHAAEAASQKRAGPSIENFGVMLEEIVRSLPVGVEIYDGNFRELFCNTVSDELFGYEYQGHLPHHDDWWERGFPDDAARARAIREWRDRCEQVRARPGEVQRAEWEVLCRDGARRTVQFRFRFIGSTYIVVFWDVTERRRLEEELRHLAGTDELTGLNNRRRFFEEAERAFSAALSAATQMSILMLDIDHFKSINDRYGHAAGDKVLSEMARRCAGALRAGDLAARVGGEEFAILLPCTDAEGAELVAQKLLSAIRAEPVQVNGTVLAVHASIGGTFRLADDRTVATLIERADRALYAAKGGGRNRVVVLPRFYDEAAPAKPRQTRRKSSEQQ